MIKIYVYRKDTGKYKYEDIGSYDGVIHDLGVDLDFTLTPPPNYHQSWYWNNAAWQPEPKKTTN